MHLVVLVAGGPGQEGDAQRGEQHQRRVVLCEFCDGALQRAALAGRLLHQAPQLRDGAGVRAGRRFHLRGGG